MLVQSTRVALRVSFSMSEQEVNLDVAQRTIIKFLTNERVKHSKILRRLEAQFGDTFLIKHRCMISTKCLQKEENSLKMCLIVNDLAPV